MKKIIWLFVIFAFITNVSAYRTGPDKISGDLIGNTVQSANEELSWTFRNGEPLEYVILDKKNVGTRKANRIYTTIYIRTRNLKGQPNRLIAEGIIELVYKKNRSGNQYYLDHISQSGFQISPINDEIDEALNEVENFWKRFIFSLEYNDKTQIAEMMNYPFLTPHSGVFASSDELIKNFERLFTFDVKSSLEKSILAPESKSKGKKFDYINDEYVQKSDYDSQIIISEKVNYFTVRRIDGKLKITGMKELN